MGPKKVEIHGKKRMLSLETKMEIHKEKVIMTPRSRCPIIINSATNLVNTAIPEEKDSSSCNTTLELNLKHSDDDDAESDACQNSPVISNPSALLFSPEPQTAPMSDISSMSKDEHESYHKLNANTDKEGHYTEVINDVDKNTKPRKLKKSSSLRRTLSSVSSTGSLFGSFFHHLSTSSLGQLATRLTSSSSVTVCPTEEEKEESPDTTVCNEGEMINESLSSVFREYLLSRSILTDNPVDLSVQFAENGTKNDIRGSCKPLDNVTDKPISVDNDLDVRNSQQCCVPEHGPSADSAVGSSLNTSLSDSLLFCLDGNTPASPIKTNGKENKYKDAELSETSTQDCNLKNATCAGLHSCTPESRQQSILETRQGTPIIPRDVEGTNNRANGRGIIFETSF
ncbi:uncharacterized protein LOC135221573 [Macrobrachium nipponense]|uniref:uncharacterized protein LOC135221573 n=1 Tax=Macrobrachium nipponense TaxID=159736 RepID=UPI0030C878A8